MTTPLSPALAAPHVRIERRLPYPRDVVFDAWTKPELLARWFAPRGCTLKFESIDVRSGGGFHACLHNPTFGDCWTAATYLELVRPQRLSFSWRAADADGNAVSPQSQGHDLDWPAETIVSVEFIAEPNGTLVRLDQNVSEALAKRTGAHPSWLQMFDILGEHLAQRAS